MKKLLIGVLAGYLGVKLAGKAFDAFAGTKLGDDVLYSMIAAMATLAEEFDASQDIRKVDDSWERRDARHAEFMKAHPIKEKESGMLNNEMFEAIFEEQVQRSRDILVEKAKQYAKSNDRMANFKAAAALQGVSIHQALAGMMAKHTYSIFDMCSSGQGYSMEMWDEKITDHINYLFLLKAACVEDMQDQKDIWQGLPYQAPSEETTFVRTGADKWERVRISDIQAAAASLNANEEFLPAGVGSVVISQEIYDKSVADLNALNSIARVLSESEEWGGEELTQVFEIVGQVRVVDLDPEPEQEPNIPAATQDMFNLHFQVGDRSSAIEIIEKLQKLMDLYNFVSVSDVKELVGDVATVSDVHFGWRKMDGIEYRISYRGTTLILPPPVPYDEDKPYKRENKAYQQCVDDGTHMKETDKDGYCEQCGEQKVEGKSLLAPEHDPLDIYDAEPVDPQKDLKAKVWEIMNNVQQRAGSMGPQSIVLEVEEIVALLQKGNES